MNSSIYGADRTTHLRIVAVALILSIAIVGLGISARFRAVGAMQVSGYPSQIQKAAQISREAMATPMVPGRI